MKGLHRRLGVRAQDLVLINTLAVPLNYFSYLEARRPQGTGAMWIHETSAEYLNGQLAEIITGAVASGRLKLFAPGIDGAQVVGHRFGAPVSVAYPFSPQEIPLSERRSADFECLRLGLVGEYASGRKGQLLALLGLARALESVPPSHQRPVMVTHFSVGPDRPGTYNVAALQEICSHFFGNRFAILPPLDRSLFLSKFRGTNVTVCSSWSESFPLFVLEGMKNSNVLVRNQVSGASEQIRHRVNGLAVPNNSIDSYREAFAELIDQRRLANDELARMGNESRSLADAIPHTDYWTEFGGARCFG